MGEMGEGAHDMAPLGEPMEVVWRYMWCVSVCVTRPRPNFIRSIRVVSQVVYLFVLLQLLFRYHGISDTMKTKSVVIRTCLTRCKSGVHHRHLDMSLVGFSSEQSCILW